MATFASANDFAAGSAPDTMLAAVENAKGAPTVRMDVVWRNLRRLQTREFMSQWNTRKTVGAIPIRVHRTERPSAGSACSAMPRGVLTSLLLMVMHLGLVLVSSVQVPSRQLLCGRLTREIRSLVGVSTAFVLRDPR